MSFWGSGNFEAASNDISKVCIGVMPEDWSGEWHHGPDGTRYAFRPATKNEIAESQQRNAAIAKANAEKKAENFAKAFPNEGDFEIHQIRTEMGRIQGRIKRRSAKGKKSPELQNELNKLQARLNGIAK